MEKIKESENEDRDSTRCQNLKRGSHQPSQVSRHLGRPQLYT